MRGKSRSRRSRSLTTARAVTSATKFPAKNSRCDCTKFDKLLLVFKDGHYKVDRAAGETVRRPDLVYCGLPERERVFTLAYTNRDATYLKRFTFGGTILNKEYHCIPPKSSILFFEPDTPTELYIRYKPAPYQKINQQTCNRRIYSENRQDARQSDLDQGSAARSTASRRAAGKRTRARRGCGLFESDF